MWNLPPADSVLHFLQYVALAAQAMTAFGLKLNAELWTALTFALGVGFRLLAIRFKWEMPKFVFDSNAR